MESKDKVEISECGKQDLDTLCQIEDIAGACYGNIVPGYTRPFVPYEAFVNAYNKGVRFFGARLGGELAGFIGYRTQKEDCFIRGLFVLPEHQGRGIGSELLRYLQCIARKENRKSIFLLTHPEAFWAVSFYIRKGFRFAGEDLDTARLWPEEPGSISTNISNGLFVPMVKTL